MQYCVPDNPQLAVLLATEDEAMRTGARKLVKDLLWARIADSMARTGVVDVVN